jgi:hypothetical protein
MKNASAVGSGVTVVEPKKMAARVSSAHATVYAQMEGESFHNGVATEKDRKAETAKVVSVASRGNRS